MATRLKATFNSEAVINWFPGHMAKAARVIKETLKKVDTVIEVRDARIPLSSANPALLEMLGPHKRHIVVFAKKDLSSPVVNLRLLEVMKEKYGIKYAMLANMQHQWRTKEKNELFNLVRTAVRDSRERLIQEEIRRVEKLEAKQALARAPKVDETEGEEAAPTDPDRPLTPEEKLELKKQQEKLNAEANRRRENAQRVIRGPTKTSISLVIGLPNVGKSTLINQIVGRRRAGVASQPGWTRGQQLYRVDGFSIEEQTRQGPKSLITPALRKLSQQSSWLLDTPGVMLPHRMETEQGLKLAICGLVADRVVPDSYLTMSEYLFHLLSHETFKAPIKIVAPEEVSESSATPESSVSSSSSSHAVAPSHQSWWRLYDFTDFPRSFDELMNYIGQRYGAKNRNDQGKIFIQHFREGKLGRFTLDFIG